MRSYPLPVIIVTGDHFLAGASSDDLIALGAITVVFKADSLADCKRFETDLVTAITRAVKDQDDDCVGQEGHEEAMSDSLSQWPTVNHDTDVDVIAIGSSTGGPQALQLVLSELTKECPPVLVAQHISEYFVRSLVQRLNRDSALNVAIASDNTKLRRGHVYVASPDSHLEVTCGSRIRLVKRDEGDLFAPSVNRLFFSLLQHKPNRVVACLLTGMGNDGAEGMLALRKRGARTIAQNEATCAVFGMPARAAECDAAEEILPIEQIAGCIERMCFASEHEMANGATA